MERQNNLRPNYINSRQTTWVDVVGAIAVLISVVYILNTYL